MSPSVAGEVTIPEQGVDDYVCAVKLVVYELVDRLVLPLLDHYVQEFGVVGLEIGGVGGNYPVEPEYLVDEIAVAALVVEGGDRLGDLSYLKRP